MPHSAIGHFPVKYPLPASCRSIMRATSLLTGLLTTTLLPGMLWACPRQLDGIEAVGLQLASPPLNCFVENGYDYVGNDIINVQGPIESCCSQCFSTSGCKAWSWTNQNGGTCYLKSARTQIVVNANVKSALLLFGPQPYCQLSNDIDFPGNDIGSANNGDPNACCGICQSTPGCRAYSWSNLNGGTCWLKSSAGQAVIKPGVKSANAYPDTCNIILEANVDYVNFDIGKQPSSSPSGCCALCQAFNGCRAFAWNSQDGGTCYFKSIIGERVSKQGVVSAQVYPNPEPPCPFEDNIDYVDNDIANVPSANYKDCCYICQGRASSGCKAFSWSNLNGGTCWLKSAKGATISKPGVRSGVIP